jgi:hypothetical protein
MLLISLLAGAANGKVEDSSIGRQKVVAKQQAGSAAAWRTSAH